MKASVEEINKVQRRIKIELATDVVNSAFAQQYRKVAQKARIKGFRPGKAPLNIIKKFYGNSVAADVADQLIRNHLFDAIRNEALNPISTPVLETSALPEEGKEYNFTALVDVMPQISVSGYKGMKLEYTPAQNDQAALDREFDILRRRSAKTKDLAPEIAVAEGHLAFITHHAHDAEGQPLPELHGHSVPVEVGKNHFLPELEKALVSMKAGEKKKVDVTLPEDFQDRSLAGKKVAIEMTVEKVQEMMLPALDDELAKDLGEESLASLQEKVKKAISDQAEQQKRHQLEFNILKELSAKNPFEVPPSMVDRVIDAMIDNLQWHNEKEKASAKRDPEFRKRFRENAKEKTRNTLILHEIINAEKLEVSEADVEKYVVEMVMGYGGAQPDQKIIDNLKKSFGPQARETLLLNKAVDFVISQATVTAASAAK